MDFQKTIDFIQDLYNTKEFIPLHEPRFLGNEKKYLEECIDSTFVSSVGKFVDRFEQMVAAYTGVPYAVATVNGTAALHIALLLSGVRQDDEVITQPLTFVATCNAISYCGAKPVFVDVERETLGMSPESLRDYLTNYCTQKNNKIFSKKTERRVSAVVPMHTFGHPCRIDEIAQICAEFNIPLVEDSAESLGSYYKEWHTGSFGLLGVLSFNGNKTITTGGGGMIITQDEALAKRARHLTTTAKIAHPYEYVHDEIGYNYRLPNLNAALGVAQMEQLDGILKNKQQLAERYSQFFKDSGVEFVAAPKNSVSNYWLNSVVLKDRLQRDEFLETTNRQGVMTRPIWSLMNHLPMFKNSQTNGLDNSISLEERVVNIPSSILI